MAQREAKERRRRGVLARRSSNESEERFLRQALALARRGRGRTHPNPMVGALVVRGGRIVGRGWHRQPGAAHAETEALARAGRRGRGATLFVSLEPCNHYGRTPPCVGAVIEAGVRRVVFPLLDPNPLVRGRGARALSRAGVRVEVGLLAREARELNAGYFKAHAIGLPWVTLKLAQSLDGRIAPRSRRGWLTGRAAARAAHRLRAGHDAVLVGADTVRLDDPRLTTRAVAGADPVRIVVSASLDLPLRARVLSPPLARGTVVVTVRPGRGMRGWERRKNRLEQRGVRVWVLSGRAARVPLLPLARRLVAEGIHSVLVEGGGKLAAAVLAARLADELRLFTAPLVLGEGVDWSRGLGFEVGDAPRLREPRLTWLGRDWLVSGRLEYGVHGDRRGDRPRARGRAAGRRAPARHR